MTHLFICREYPPAAYWPGGIGTYVHHIANLLAQAGETVHVISHRWDGARHVREESHEGRLIVHRVALDDPVPGQSPFPLTASDPSPSPMAASDRVPRGMLASSFPSQAFSWQASLLAERLIGVEGIDVIEGQEWEAPLYYLQLRRALDHGPKRRPPIVVHLHSPTELIFAANGWDTSVADYRPAASMEAYSIEAADALVCPSRYLADQALARYRIESSRLSVIPYPLGDFPRIERRADIWSNGSICYVGRLEPRKGVLEWAQAVASVAVEYPSLAVDFVGGDMPLGATGGSTVRDAIRDRLPRLVRRQFRFHGNQDCGDMSQVLSRACAAVVPSRWENFPYSCIESMSSGLPVIASPLGGMRELVVDEVSGWIAADVTPEGLAGALRRMLDTPAAQREQMGDAAAETVRHVCDNDTIVARHLEVKGDLARLHAPESTRAAVRRLPPAAAMAAISATPSRPRTTPRHGIGLVVTCQSHGSSLGTCLSSIRGQTAPPLVVCIVADGVPRDVETIGDTEGWQVVQRAGRSGDEAAVAAAEALARNNPSLTGLAFVDSRIRLDPDCLCVSRGAGTRHLRWPGVRLDARDGFDRSSPDSTVPDGAVSVARGGGGALCRREARRVRGCPPSTGRARFALSRRDLRSGRDVRMDRRHIPGGAGRGGPRPRRRGGAATRPSVLVDRASGAADPHAALALVHRWLTGGAARAAPPGLQESGARGAVACGAHETRTRQPLAGSGRLPEATALTPGPQVDLGGRRDRSGSHREALVSVVMAAFNAERTIAAACLTVLKQTHATLELLVVDDGSTDSTVKVVRSLAAADPRIRLIVQENLGVAAARNRGIAEASGAFIAPIDADDVWDPTKIERQVRRLEECGAETGLAYCWWAWIDSTGTVLECSPRWRVEGHVLSKLVEVNFTGSASVPLYRRSCIEEVGGYNLTLREQGCGGCEDWDLALRVAERYALSVVPAVLVGYRRRAQGMSNNRGAMWRSREQVVTALANRQRAVPPDVLQRSRAQFALYLAGVAFWSGNYLYASYWALRARSLTLGFAVLPHVVRMFARRLLGMEPPRPTLTSASGRFEETSLPEPAIPYDRIYARRWRARARE